MLGRREHHGATTLSESRPDPAGLVMPILDRRVAFPGRTMHALRALPPVATSRSLQRHKGGHTGVRRSREEPEEGWADWTRGQDKPRSPRAGNMRTRGRFAEPTETRSGRRRIQVTRPPLICGFLTLLSEQEIKSRDR